MNALDYFKDRYKDEIDTFNHLENKAAKLLTFLSIIIGALGTTAGFKSGALFHLEPHLPWTWAKLAIFIFSILFSSFSWWHALLALKIGDCPVLPRGQDAADFICFYEDKRNKSKREFEKLSHSKKLRDELIYWHVNTIKELSEVNKRKAEYIDNCYSELSISAVFLAMCAVITIIMEIVK